MDEILKTQISQILDDAKIIIDNQNKILATIPTSEIIKAELEAYKQAQDAKIEELVKKEGVLTLKGTRSTTGAWTITGLTPYKRLTISGGFPILSYAEIAMIDTPSSGLIEKNMQSTQLGFNDDVNECLIFTPTSTSITLNVVRISQTIYAYQ